MAESTRLDYSTSGPIDAKERGNWSSEPAFIFAMAAAAVGLGNLWRFPYMVGEHGGAAFIIAYLICLLVIALPIMLIEVGAGRRHAGAHHGRKPASERPGHPRRHRRGHDRAPGRRDRLILTSPAGSSVPGP